MHYVVAIPLDKKLAEFIGKGGAEGSINFYNRKVDDNVIVGLAPNSLEEKFYAVAETFLISSQILLSTYNIDKLFGELLVACSLLDKHVIFTNDNSVDHLLGAIKLSNYEVSPKEELVTRILAIKNGPEGQGSVRVDIDHAFPVKGIGCVALGIVTKGTLKVHDELYHSSGKTAMVKSIQSQDIDIQSAGPGTRVGLALRGIEHEDISKGDLLTKEKVPKVSQIKAKVTLSPIAKEELVAQGRYSIVSNFSFSNVLIEGASGGEIVLKLEKPLAIAKGDVFLILREKAPRIFAKGEVL